MKWLLVFFISLAFVSIIIFLIRGNIKDEKIFKAELKNIYPENNEGENDTATAEIVK